MYYLTFIDTYSGIYQSQVIDVIKYLNNKTGKNIKLIAFIPPQGYSSNKSKIKKAYKNAIVSPIFAGISRWKYCKPLLYFFNKKKTIICRGPLAAKLAIGTFNNVIYDGRAAVKAEVEEYDVVSGNIKLGNDFIQAEKDAVLKANYRIAVSHKLINYWETEIGYKNNKHVIIPCTLSSLSTVAEVKSTSNTIKIVYAGGTGGWQSFEKVVSLFENALGEYSDIEVLFLTKENKHIDLIQTKYPDRCKRKWLAHSEVSAELASCDYGILIRENKITNQVASPVKFAEYLGAGLKVLISENLGDFTEFVTTNNCGIIINQTIPKLVKLSLAEKEHSKQLCSTYFLKNAPIINDSFDKLINHL